MTAILQSKDYSGKAVLYMAMELSNANWKLGFSNGSRDRSVTIIAGDWEALSRQIGLAKEKLHLPEDCPVISCFEAVPDGFWVHRMHGQRRSARRFPFRVRPAAGSLPRMAWIRSRSAFMPSCFPFLRALARAVSWDCLSIKKGSVAFFRVEDSLLCRKNTNQLCGLSFSKKKPS